MTILTSGSPPVIIKQMHPPFSRFARFYDRFMEKYVDYEGWVNYLLRIFRKHRHNPAVIIDLACGTGIPTILLAKKGYRIIGIDRSPEMLAVLLDKKGNLPIEVLCADIRSFTLPIRVDAAVSFYDSINYLLTEKDLTDCFRSACNALKENGIFVFDMNTVYGLEKHWGNRTITRETDELISIWQCSFDPATMISNLHLIFWEKLPDGTVGSKYEELHRERAYTINEIRTALLQAGFNQVRFYHHGTFLPVGPLTSRMMIVAEKRTDLQPRQ